MLDIKLFRENPDVIKQDLVKRGEDTGIVDKIVELDKEWRQTKIKLQELQHKRNTVTKEIAELKKKGEDTGQKITEMREVNQKIKEMEERARELEKKRDDLRLRVPNLTHESVPVGKDDTDNIMIRTWGKPIKKDFELKPHQDVLEILGLADFDAAAKASGRGFYYLLGQAALLDLAIQRFALDELQKKEYTIVEPPLMLRRKAMQGVVDLSAFEEVLYKVENEDLYLIATSEHPLAAMHMDQVISEESLPLRYAGISPCFRKEIGSHGVDTKGLFRVHQFHKIEQFVYSMPEKSWEEHEKMITIAEELFQKLEIPYRVVNVCTGDLGGTAAKKYDIEAWMARQGNYKEVVSCSNCTDYQARKLNIRYQKKNGERGVLHTLNSTAIATGRAMVAIIENNQQPDGTVVIPKVLQKYMDGQEILEPRKKPITY